jgi:hypothetical protein
LYYFMVSNLLFERTQPVACVGVAILALQTRYWSVDADSQVSTQTSTSLVLLPWLPLQLQLCWYPNRHPSATISNYPWSTWRSLTIPHWLTQLLPLFRCFRRCGWMTKLGRFRSRSAPWRVGPSSENPNNIFLQNSVRGSDLISSEL